MDHRPQPPQPQQISSAEQCHMADTGNNSRPDHPEPPPRGFAGLLHHGRQSLTFKTALVSVLAATASFAFLGIVVTITAESELRASLRAQQTATTSSVAGDIDLSVRAKITSQFLA